MVGSQFFIKTFFQVNFFVRRVCISCPLYVLEHRFGYKQLVVLQTVKCKIFHLVVYEFELSLNGFQLLCLKSKHSGDVIAHSNHVSSVFILSIF